MYKYVFEIKKLLISNFNSFSKNNARDFEYHSRIEDQCIFFSINYTITISYGVSFAA